MKKSIVWVLFVFWLTIVVSCGGPIGTTTGTTTGATTGTTLSSDKAITAVQYHFACGDGSHRGNEHCDNRAIRNKSDSACRIVHDNGSKRQGRLECTDKRYDDERLHKSGCVHRDGSGRKRTDLSRNRNGRLESGESDHIVFYAGRRYLDGAGFCKKLAVCCFLLGRDKTGCMCV